MTFCAASLSLLLVAVVGVTAFGVIKPTEGDTGARMIQFALAFKCVNIDGVNHATANSQSLISDLSGTFPRFSVMKGEGVAYWTSILVNQSATSWWERGNITFDDDKKDILHFESPGMTGVIYGPNYGAISYNITGGTGKFKGASGMMVDTFIAPPNSTTFDINAWGFVWLPL